MDPDTLNCRVGQLIFRAWTDEAFKELLASDPTAAFALYDIPVPEGKELKVLFDSDNLSTFVIPPPL